MTSFGRAMVQSTCLGVSLFILLVVAVDTAHSGGGCSATVTGSCAGSCGKTAAGGCDFVTVCTGTVTVSITSGTGVVTTRTITCGCVQGAERYTWPGVGYYSTCKCNF